MIPYIALILTIAGVIIGASVITLSTFKGTITDKCYNSSFTLNAASNGCTNTSSLGAGYPTTACCGEDNLNLSDTYYSLVKTIDSENTIAEQQPTVAIIAVMVIIISIIAGVFVYMKVMA